VWQEIVLSGGDWKTGEYSFSIASTSKVHGFAKNPLHFGTLAEFRCQIEPFGTRSLIIHFLESYQIRLKCVYYMGNSIQIGLALGILAMIDVVT
jgi:hypothetical protein